MKRALNIVAACLAVGSLPPRDAGAKEVPYLVQRFHPSARHPEVLFAARPAIADGTLIIQFRAGSHDDKERPGLTRLSQHVLLESNARSSYEELSLELIAASATLSLETGIRSAAVILTAPRDRFDALATKVLQMVLAPRIDESEFAAARSRTLADEFQSNENLDSILAITLFRGSALGNAPFGRRDVIETITLAEVKRHLEGPLSPANATVVVAGAFHPDRLRSVLGGLHGGQALPRLQPEKDLAGMHQMRAMRETHLAAFPVKLTSRDSVAGAQLLASVLNTRVRRQFRARGVAYSAQTVALHRDWLDFLLVILPVAGDDSTMVMRYLTEETERVRNGQLPADELEASRSNLLKELARAEESSAPLARMVAMGDGDIDWYGPELVARISSMTGAELGALAASWLEPKGIIHVFLNPKVPPQEGGFDLVEQPRRRR